jgi:hypothetical protein
MQLRVNRSVKKRWKSISCEVLKLSSSAGEGSCWSGVEAREEFEIERILHLKSEIPKSQIGPQVVPSIHDLVAANQDDSSSGGQFEISGFRIEIGFCPISQFSPFPD